tara:strand:- start:1952 stop:2860 length:909 start_codon:yes stop_codon:yes gene_type:complete
VNNVLILGGGGWSASFFISYIIEKKLHQSFNFIAVDKEFNSTNKHISSIKGDLLDGFFLKKLIVNFKPYYIINFAGLFKSDNSAAMLDVNFTISYNLLSAIKELKIKPKNILFIGSAAEYGEQNKDLLNETLSCNPINIYGLTKSLQTTLMSFYKKNYALKICIARPFNLVGKGMPKSLALGSFISQIQSCKDGSDVSVGNLNTERDFTHIKDAVKAYWLLLECGESGETYNICSGKTYKIENVLKKLIIFSGKNLIINTDHKRKQKNDLNTSCGDSNKIFNLTGWKPSLDVLSSLKEHFNG